MSMEPHIADAEDEFIIYNVPPDFCEVDDEIVPFDIVNEMTLEKEDYAKTVFARSEPVLMVKSIVKGTEGNTGSGIDSLVSQESGHLKAMDNQATVFAEDRAVIRHKDLFWMNGRVDG